MVTSTCCPVAKYTIMIDPEQVSKAQVVDLLKNQHNKYGSKERKIKNLMLPGSNRCNAH
jgi:hypothetical protein